MKKFFPVIFIAGVFVSMLISQMLINGQELSASRLDKNRERYSIYENQYANLKAKTTHGKDVILKNVKNPIVIVNFWASWCRPCISEFKSLNRLIETYGDKVFVLGINNDTEEATRAIKKVEKEYKLKFESIKDTEGKYASLFNVTKVPSTIVFHDGKVLTSSEKEFDFMSDDFQNLIKKQFN